MEINNSVKNAKKLPVTKGSGKSRKGKQKPKKAAKKKIQKLINPFVYRINKSIEDLINTPSRSKTKEKTAIDKSIPNDLNLSIPETDFEDNSNPNQFEKNSDIQARGNISQENQDQIEVISVESPEKSQPENQTKNWKKLLTQAREKTTISKSNQGKPTKKSNVGKKTRKIIPLDLKLSIIQMHEDGGSNTKIARDKGQFFRDEAKGGFSVGNGLKYSVVRLD